MSATAMPHAEILEGDLRDLDEVMQTMDEAFDADFGEAWTRGQCEEMFLHTGIWLGLARRDGIAAGFALARMIADEAELLLLAVQPAVRRDGIGRALLDRAIASAVRRGADRLYLEVREDNPAIALYRAAGFREVGRRNNYYRGRGAESFHALTFELRLVAPSQ